MAESQNREAQIGAGKRWVEQMCGRNHTMAEVHWHDHDETADLRYWLTLSPHQQREAVHLTFTLQELADCATDLDVRVHLRRRIQDDLSPWLVPREAQDF